MQDLYHQQYQGLVLQVGMLRMREVISPPPPIWGLGFRGSRVQGFSGLGVQGFRGLGFKGLGV